MVEDDRVQVLLTTRWFWQIRSVNKAIMGWLFRLLVHLLLYQAQWVFSNCRTSLYQTSSALLYICFVQVGFQSDFCETQSLWDGEYLCPRQFVQVRYISWVLQDLVSFGWFSDMNTPKTFYRTIVRIYYDTNSAWRTSPIVLLPCLLFPSCILQRF